MHPPSARRAARVLALGAGLLLLAAAPAGAATIAGTLYRDADGDGLRDPGEAPVPGVVVKLGGPGVEARDVTDERGAYAFATTTTAPGEERTVEVLTGWFRTGCLMRGGNLCLGALGGPDDDLDVDNEFLRRTVPVPDDASTVILDAGLTPDWGDPGTPFPGPRGPWNAVDPALRFSGSFPDCAPERRCLVGAVVKGRLQLFNSGTEPLTGLTATLTFPEGTRYAWSRGLRLLDAPPGIGLELARPYDEATRTMALRLAGTLAPAAEAVVQVPIKVVGGPFTDDPVDRSPWPTQVVAEVSGVDQGADADAANDDDPADDQDLGHSINWPAADDEDDHDPVGFNVVR